MSIRTPMVLAVVAASLGFAVSACTPGGTGSVSLEQRLSNPLTAEYYYEDLTQQMVTLIINNDPILQDGAKKDLVESTRIASVDAAKAAVARQNDGGVGRFNGVGGAVNGEALLLGKTVYFGPDFNVAPSPNMRVYLTDVVDPRDVMFPDASSTDLGPIQSPYGAQEYAVAELPAGGGRTAVLWDSALEQIIAFAQLGRIGN